MKYRNAAIIFLAGMACATLGIWLLNGLFTSNAPASSEAVIEAGDVGDVIVPAEIEKGESSGPVEVRRQPTPTRTELLAHQMALRSGREMKSTQEFYEEMLPKSARLCTDVDGMSDIVNMLVRSHERILDLGLKEPEDLVDVSYNLYSIFIEMAPKTRSDMSCKRVADIYIELRSTGSSKAAMTRDMIRVIREQ